MQEADMKLTQLERQRQVQYTRDCVYKYSYTDGRNTPCKQPKKAAMAARPSDKAHFPAEVLRQEEGQFIRKK